MSCKFDSEVFKQITKIAWSFARVYPEVDVEDLIGEGVLAYLQAAEQFDESRGKLSTFLHTVVRNHLCSVVPRYLPLQYAPLTEDVPSSHAAPDIEAAFQEFIRNCPPPVQDAIKMIVSAPHEFNLPPKLLRGELRRRLLSLGYTHRQIDNVFNYLQNALS